MFGSIDLRSLAIACVSLLLLSCVGTQGLPPVSLDLLVPAPSDDPLAEPQDANPAGPHGAAGMRVYIDPETGEFGVPPPEVAPPEAGPEVPLLFKSLSIPSQELVEVPGTTAAGGFTVQLNDQFQRVLTVTPDADGKLSIRCVDKHPGKNARD